MKIRRVNLIAGPGVGKDTCAAGLFHQFKKAGYNCELITEYVKKWTYTNRVQILGTNSIFAENRIKWSSQL